MWHRDTADTYVAIRPHVVGVKVSGFLVDANSYLGELAADDDLQFIIATQSPVIIDSAKEGELYFLGQPDIGKSPENQLTLLSGESAKIDSIREITGDVAIVTSGRRFLCVEGRRSKQGRNEPTDQRVLEILCPELNDVALLPMGGKSQVISNATLLRGSLPPTLANRVYARVDSDQTPPGTGELPSWVVRL